MIETDIFNHAEGGIMQSRNAIIAGLSSLALALGATQGAAAHTPEPLHGCYEIERASMFVSALGDGRVIGTYKYVLASEGDSDRVVLRGSVTGAESTTGGSHLFGTKHREGVFATSGDSVQPIAVDCFDPETGKPRLVEAVETLNFSSGTGIFAGLTEGTVVFDVVFDGCTDPANPVADLHASSGHICFE